MNAYLECTPLAAMVMTLKRHGYTHAKSMQGPIPLDEWDPYGMIRNKSERQYHGVVIPYEGELEVHDLRRGPEYPGSERFVLGIWQFTKGGAHEGQEAIAG